jgi:hypothetical protein
LSHLAFDCHLKYVIDGKIEGRIEVTKRRGIKRKQLLDDLKEQTGYCRLKEKAPDRTLWRIPYVQAMGLVRQTAG